MKRIQSNRDVIYYKSFITLFLKRIQIWLHLLVN